MKTTLKILVAAGICIACYLEPMAVIALSALMTASAYAADKW